MVFGACSELQQGGMSGGGGKICAFRPFPFFTTNAMSMPHVICRSKWQCRNQTPIITKHKQHHHHHHFSINYEGQRLHPEHWTEYKTDTWSDMYYI